MIDHEEPGYLARLASRATQPATGLRPRTAGMFEGGTSAGADTSAEAVGGWTQVPKAEHIAAADVEGRESALRPGAAAARQVEATVTAAGPDVPADTPDDVRTGVLDGATDGAWTPAVPPEWRSLWAADTSVTDTSVTDAHVTDAHDTASAWPNATGAQLANFPIANGKNVFHEVSDQTTSGETGGAAPLEVVSHEAPPGGPNRAPGRLDLDSPSPSPRRAPSPRPTGEAVRGQGTLPAPDPPGLPRLHPSKPEPDAPAAGVTVTIGRIEVLPPAPDKPPRKPPRQRARPATAPQLSDYLRQRRDGG